jgi:hypothetical protein
MNFKICKKKKDPNHINGKPITQIDFFVETLLTRRAWNDVFQVLKKNNCQWTLLYQTRISFRNEGEMWIFQEKEKLGESVTTRPTLQRRLKEALYPQLKKKDNIMIACKSVSPTRKVDSQKKE